MNALPTLLPMPPALQSTPPRFSFAALPFADLPFPLAYRPFLDPLPVWAHDYWLWLIVPLCLLIACAYKAVRLPEEDLAPRVYVRKVAAMTAQTLAVMAALAVGAYLFIEFVVPLYG